MSYRGAGKVNWWVGAGNKKQGGVLTELGIERTQLRRESAEGWGLACNEEVGLYSTVYREGATERAGREPQDGEGTGVRTLLGVGELRAKWHVWFRISFWCATRSWPMRQFGSLGAAGVLPQQFVAQLYSRGLGLCKQNIDI